MQQAASVFGLFADAGAAMVMSVLLALSAAAGAIMQALRLGGRRERSRVLDAVTLEGLLVTEHGKVVAANQAACRMLGRPHRAIVGQPIEAFFAAEYRQEILRMPMKLEATLLAELLCARGVRRGVDVVMRTGANIVFALREVCDHEAAARRSAALPYLDRLTGVASDALLRDRLAQALAISDRSGASIAVMRLSIDRVDEINATMGRHVGDRVLEAAAKRLRGATRDIDTVARLEDGDFVVVQPFAKQPDSVKALSRRILSALGAPYVIDGHVIVAPARVGLALHPNDATTVDDLLIRARKALERARGPRGGALRFFDEALDRALQGELQLDAGLRLALEQGEMVLHFQPIFEAERLELTGYEALLRWDCPSRGLLSPADFLPLAEQCGMAAALGQWVLDSACAAAATWSRSVCVAINLPVAQFHQPDLPIRIAEALARNNVAAERLELEITENILIENTDQALATLRALKAQGVRISLNDFGRGYASLTYLRLFPFDKIKMDRSFVSELGTDPNAERIVHAMLLMARSLMIEVTAVGVESRPQLELLQSLKCDYVQGFVLGRPSPLREAALPPAEPAAIRRAQDRRENRMSFAARLAPDESFSLASPGIG